MRLLVVSNRLPFTVVERDGELTFTESVGGLVSGLSAYLDSLKGSSFTESEYLWIGWPGITVKDEAREELKSKILTKFQAHPVFLSEETMEKFYHGFCNKTLWPLFHYFPSYVAYDEDYWSCYKRVNEIFGQAIIEILRPDDVVWIHDYHLMLLPRLIRDRMPDIPIGFFLHIPFPSFEIFRLLPMKLRHEILEGLLGADLIGFHTHDYTQYFLRCILRTLGFQHHLGRMIANDHTLKADTFPMGIDFQRFSNAVSCPEILRERDGLRKALAGLKVILSIDRLDYTKGIINRLRGYEIFLERNPQWHKRVTLVLVAVPSRIGVDHYQRIKNQLDEMVGKINGRFGDIDWTPILYQYKFLPFNPLAALYSISDVALITPLRDGMNLIAKEYVATRTNKTGVLILSEMAGSSKELGEAIIINPNSIEEIAAALQEALEMPGKEQIRRNRFMQTRLQGSNVVRWAKDFINELRSIKEEQKRIPKTKGKLFQDFIKAQRRLILLDYDGTLVPFTGDPQMARPTKKLLEILKRLSDDHRTELVIISGRDKDTLQEWFGLLHLGLVAEHGTWIKEKGQDWRMPRPVSNLWKPKILPVLEMFTDRLPGSFVEEKEYSIAWHYRMADADLGSLRARELADYLVDFTANIDIQVSQGNKLVEVRNAGVDKGNAALHILSKGSFDFVLAVGDDWTDNDLFRILPDEAYSVRVGTVQFYANFNLPSHKHVVNLLHQLAEGAKPSHTSSRSLVR
ncbi:MAG: bifunctional alpha,alpha-trehalose-phosphate synthase (UDP-forming)/trehalose-phosphatase [Chloroflexi bacterium]|nr:bifunctional alpha,alpha-trehalose-phosphate synthase (UDP-forming)/trehalose-phosphatase [Chloroflexota bacterium]